MGKAAKRGLRRAKRSVKKVTSAVKRVTRAKARETRRNTRLARRTAKLNHSQRKVARRAGRAQKTINKEKKAIGLIEQLQNQKASTKDPKKLAALNNKLMAAKAAARAQEAKADWPSSESEKVQHQAAEA